jgi:hypothetical protein
MLGVSMHSGDGASEEAQADAGGARKFRNFENHTSIACGHDTGEAAWIEDRR